MEEVSPNVTGVLPFTYLMIGTQINLGSDGQVALAYLAACTEEVIKGGHVSVGVEGSLVDGGHLKRQKVTCPPIVQPAPAESSQSSTMVFRAPVQMVGSKYLFITLPAAGRVTITAEDGAEEPLVLDT